MLELNVRGIFGAAIGIIGDPPPLGVELIGLSKANDADEPVYGLEKDDEGDRDTPVEGVLLADDN